MKSVIFSFIPATPGSMIASARIARFVSKTLDIPLVWDESVEATRWDVLILVNGAFSFCKVRDNVAVAVRRAKRIVWIQNDYAIYPPTHESVGESAFRKAFALRERTGLPRMDFWTTVRENVSRTEASRYVNWNTLTALVNPLTITSNADPDLFYYGSWRQYRDKSFDRYFAKQRLPICISSASKKFEERYPHASILTMIARNVFYRELNAHGFGLYIEDVRSHRQFHSPANRFYEMLSAGLPMVFEPESRPMLRRAGFDPSGFLVRHQRDICSMLPERDAIAAEQRQRWWHPFRDTLSTRVRAIHRAYVQRYF